MTLEEKLKILVESYFKAGSVNAKVLAGELLAICQEAIDEAIQNERLRITKHIKEIFDLPDDLPEFKENT